jgi:uncharacterized protein
VRVALRTGALVVGVVGALAATRSPAAPAKIPPLERPVTDAAAMLTVDTRATLDTTLGALWRSGGSQVAVLTWPKLAGEALEPFAIRVVDTWRLGHKGRDDGVLLLLVRDDRQMRLEVGRGLEGTLTDLASRRILDETMRPRLAAGDPDGAVLAGVRAVLAVTDPRFDASALARADHGAPLAAPAADDGGATLPLWLLVLVPLLVFWRLVRRGRRGFGPFVAGPGFGRGGAWGAWRGRRDGGGDGGDFGGGGGGFGGGGASSRW